MRRSTRWRVISIFAVAMLLGAVLAAEQPPTQLLEDFDATWQHNAWQFYNGAEFPGANGSFERGRDAAHTGEFGGKLNFDFTGGGTYVAAIRRLTGAPDIQAVRLWLKDPGKNGVTFRYTDSTGQTLQKTVFLPPHGEWTEATIACAGWDLFWGGAKDGTVHGPPTQIAILAGEREAVVVSALRVSMGALFCRLWRPLRLWRSSGAGISRRQARGLLCDPMETCILSPPRCPSWPRRGALELGLSC